jgi:hypothetical protein
MKTFLEFITEAELIENDQQELAQINAKIKFLQQKISAGKGKPEDKDTLEELGVQRAELSKEVSASAKVGAELNKDKPQEPENRNTKVVGYASKPKDVVSRVGSTSDVQRTDIEQEPDVITGSRYKKPGVSGGRGTNIGRTGGTYGTKKG